MAAFRARQLISSAQRTHGSIRSALISEAEVQTRGLKRAMKNVERLTADSDTYLSRPGTYFVAEHVAAKVEVTSGSSPRNERLRGDELAQNAVATMSLNIGVAAAFLLAALAQAYARWQRWLVVAGTLVLLVSLVLFGVVGFGV